MEPDLKRLRPLFVLEGLSPKVRSDVLSDGSAASALDLAIKREVHFPNNISIRREELFTVVRGISEIQSAYHLHDQNNNVIDVRSFTTSDGAAIVEIGTTRVQFPWAILLSSEPSKRQGRLEKILVKYPLCMRDADWARAIARNPTYADDDFLRLVLLLESSPQAFADTLNDRFRLQGEELRLAAIDLLPGDARYWDHLVPPVEKSHDLAEYIKNELNVAWRTQIDQDAVTAFNFMAKTFAAPGLIPHSLLQAISNDEAAAALEAIANVEDHFSLAGAFEFCANRASTDDRFSTLGNRLLDRLFGNMERLTRVCALFGAIFILGTAYLAEHEVLQRRPVYWRRLAAVAHASLVVRVCGSSSINSDEIVNWAMSVSGVDYFLSVLSDFIAEPRWRPEWITPKFLVADVYGRASSIVVKRSSDAVSDAWRQHIQKAQPWIDQENIGPFTQYPAVLEGSRCAQQITLDGLRSNGGAQIADAIISLGSNPSIQDLLSITPFIETVGVPKEMIDAAFAVLTLIRVRPHSNADSETLVAFSILAHIAVLANNGALADRISEACLEAARTANKSHPIFEIVARLVECASVNRDRAEALETLTKRLETLAFTLPAARPTAALVSALKSLKRVQPDLRPLLGKALAATQLGTSRAPST